MKLEELKALHQRAANYPGQGQGFSLEESCFAGPFCQLAQEVIDLVEAVSGFQYYDDYQLNGGPEYYESVKRMNKAFAELDAKLEAL